MGNGSTGFSCGKSGTAGIGEEVQYLNGLISRAVYFSFPDKTGEPVPVSSLLGKKAGVLETEGL